MNKILVFDYPSHQDGTLRERRLAPEVGELFGRPNSPEDRAFGYYKAGDPFQHHWWISGFDLEKKGRRSYQLVLMSNVREELPR